MEHSPNIDMAGPFNIEDQIRITLQGPETESGQIQLARVALGPAARMAAEVIESQFQRPNESQSSLPGRLGRIVRKRFLDVPIRPLTRDNRMDLQRRGRALATRPALRLRRSK